MCRVCSGVYSMWVRREYPVEEGGSECSGTIWTPAATDSKPTKTTTPWEAVGFVPGVQVRPTGLSWNKSPNSKKWIGCVGTIVPGHRLKSKGITVRFEQRTETEFHDYFVYSLSNLQLVKPEEPEMPKETKTPESKSPLYLALRESLETKDRETLDTRTENLLAQVQVLVGGVVAVETAEVGTKESVGIEGLVSDPGEEAIGKWGFFWDDPEDELVYGRLKSVDTDDDEPYLREDGNYWKHFAHIPNSPSVSEIKADVKEDT